MAGTEKTLIAASIVAGFLLSASVAGATTIALTPINDNLGGDAPSYSTASLTFTLPSGFTNAVLQTSTFAADDRAVMELNGDVVSSTGIYGPGVGNFYFGQWPKQSLYLSIWQ